MKIKYKIINIIALLSVIIFTFVGCIADKNRPQSKKVDDTNKEQIEYQVGLKLKAGNNETEVNNNTIENVTTTMPATTTSKVITTTPITTEQTPVTTTTPTEINSLSLHKNTPEFEVKKLENTEIINPDGSISWKTNLQPYKINEVANIKGNTLTYRVVKISESNYNYSNYRYANNIKKVYDIELEVCAKYGSVPLYSGIYVYLLDNNNESINSYIINNPSSGKNISNNNVSTFHIIIGTEKELKSNCSLTITNQNGVTMAYSIKYIFNSLEIK